MSSVIHVNGKWRAQIRRRGFAAQCRTFGTKAQADKWARQREGELDIGGVMPQLTTLKMTDVFAAYRDLRDRSRPIVETSNEHYILKALERGLGGLQVTELTPDHLVGYATMRRNEGAGPYTINMDVSKLGTVMRNAGAVLKVALPDVVGAARTLLTHLRLIGGGGKRERRPTEDEMQRVLAAITEKRGKVYAEAVRFAAASAMRRGEICAIGLADVDPTTHIVQVWREHPRKGKTLERVPLLGEAWTIAMRQPPSADGRLFPIEPGTLSKYFTEACRSLSIPDLHLHDMRHEAASSMFEDKMTIEQVALVTGHRSWNQLRRYTDLKPEDLTAASPRARKRPGAPPPPGSRRTASRSPRT